MANSLDLDLHCLLTAVCPKTLIFLRQSGVQGYRSRTLSKCTYSPFRHDDVAA